MRALCFIACLALSATAFAHEGGVRGRVSEEGFEETPVVGATIRIEDHDARAQTDDEGRFALENVPAGARLIIEADGYLPAEVIADGDVVNVALVYEDEATYGAVAEVRSDVDRMAASAEHLSRADLNATPMRTAEEALRQVPGLTLVQHGSEGKGFQYTLRGFDASHGADLAISVEGIPLNEWSNIHAQGYLDLGIVLPELIQSVDVDKGPFHLDQGAFAMAGSADYRLGVASEDRGASIAVTGGTTGRARLFGAYAPRDGSAFVAAEVTHDEGYGQMRRMDRATANAQVRIFEGTRTSVDALVLASFADFELPGTVRNEDVREGRIAFDGAYDPLTVGRSARAIASIGLEHRSPSANLSLRSWAGHRRLDLRENFTGFLFSDESDRRDQAQESTTFGVQAAYHRHLTEHFTLLSGAGFIGEVFSQSERNVGANGERGDLRRSLDAFQGLGHMRLGVRYEPSTLFRIDAGARGDLMAIAATDVLSTQDGSATDVAVSPRLQMRLVPHERLAVYASYGRGYRPPEARAYTTFDPGTSGIGDEVFGGEPKLTVSDAFELGVRLDLLDELQVRAAGFATLIERESVFDHVSGVSLELNGTRRIGGEFIVSAQPAPWLTLQGDLTLVDARFSESGARVPFAPRLTAGARATLNHSSGVGAGLRWIGIGPRPLPFGAQGAFLSRVDLTVSYRWKWLRLHLAVENLLNTQLREGEFQYASYWPSAGGRRSELPALHTTAGAPLNARLTVGVVY